ncbi:unnamed protein product [marine sediment metagenome]|uniref:Restriction alleviation protein, Lar family n=1 Tax=marine sediment metagenome TaxID=412755 RepID=X0WPM2_9ZZZZ
MEEMKPCPFCGAVAEIINEPVVGTYQIVGCSNRLSMLCPAPSLVVYADEFGKYDYKWWNRRND